MNMARTSNPICSGVPTPYELCDLIEKLETANEGSRELDACVWVATNGKGQPMKKVGPPSYKVPRFFCNPDPDIDWIGYDLLRIAPTYTTSLDAALTLVPVGANGYRMCTLLECYSSGTGNASIIPFVGKRVWSRKMATPALALCIAAIKVRAALSDFKANQENQDDI